MAFHGREGDLAALLAAVSEHRLVTVTGPVGVGKSRLVAEAAEALEEGFGRIGFHSLASVPAGSDAATIAGHLGRSSADGLALQLAMGAELLVLDGCDHVLAGAAALAGELLAADDSISLVVTSREPLHLSEERVQVLAPFTVPGPGEIDSEASPALALFLERSRAVGAQWPLDPPILTRIAELCRELDGLPLAIELAAVRTRTLSPDDLGLALRNKLDLFDSAPRDGALGSGLRAALAESLEQLGDTERRVLRRLSVLPTAFDVPTAQAVAAVGQDSLATVNALDALVDRSLLLVENTASVSHYRLLGVVREIAAEDLEAAGETEEGWDRFAEVMAATADRLVAAALQRWSGEVVGAVAVRVTLLLAAVDWCVAHDPTPERALRLYLPLFGGVHQSRSAEVRASGERLFERWPDEQAPLRAECLAVVATAAAVASETTRARMLAEAALADPAVTAVGRVVAHRALLLAALGEGELDDAEAQAAAGERAATEAGMGPFARELRTFTASITDRRGRPGEGLRLAVEAAVEAEETDDAVNELWARVVAANIAARAEDWAEVRGQVDAARLASTAAATEVWSARVFRSDALLATYGAIATSYLDGWPAAVPAWREAMRVAAAGGGVLEIATTVRSAAAVARAVGPAPVADALDAAIPATDELDVLPEVFERDPRQRLRSGPRATASFCAALDALRPAGELGALRSADDSATAPHGLLRRDGDTWEIAYGGATARTRHLKGIADLAALLSAPDREVHVLELMGVVEIGESAGPAIDDRARHGYRTQVLDLQGEIDEARAGNDLARVERAEAELDALVAELSSALGLGGRDRRAGSTVERARSAVTFRVRTAIKRIGEQHDELGRHLRNSIRTGTWCAYRPEQAVQWEIDAG